MVVKFTKIVEVKLCFSETDPLPPCQVWGGKNHQVSFHMRGSGSMLKYAQLHKSVKIFSELL